MKLMNHNNECLKYKHNDEIIEIPDYIFNPDSLRACWIANVLNMDTSIMKDIKEYQEQLIKILETLKSYNMNTAIFHVRPCNDAYYPSNLNPWSKYITGVQGKDPGFDVLEFFIKEAKKRNISVHAWFNPYRVNTEDITTLNMSKDEYLDTLAENNFARVHKDHTILDGTNKIILRPGHIEVIEFVVKSIMEVVENYDIEAIHIDDFFYPYAPILKEDEWDDYFKYRKDDKQSFEDWRRSNIDEFILLLHKELANYNRENNKKIEFGVSPFPIYRTNKSILETGWEKGSYHSKGVFQCYDGQFCDIYKWMKNGWIDYVVPQDYFSFTRRDVTYHDICWWWANICLETKTKLYIGHAIYHIGEVDTKHSSSWQNPNELHNQLAFNTNFENIKGSVIFRYKSLIFSDNQILNQALEILKNDWNGKS